jgi:hypothetical protein
MPAFALKRSLKVLAVLAVAVTAASTQKAGAANCPGDPWFFCDCARAAAQQCWLDYQNCGGFFVEGCWETYSQCRTDSGIDQCE